MDKIKGETWRQRHRPTTRRLVQVYSALLYNAHLKGFVTGEIYRGNTKAVCVPGLNCYSCPGAVGACPLGAIQNALAAAGHRAGWYVLGIIMLFGLTLGRTICGWLCPLGLIQELLHKIPTPKIKKSRITRALSYLKYVILVVFVAAVPMWYGIKHDLAVPGFCKYICPAGTFEGAIGLLSNPGNAGYFSMLKILFTRKFVIMLVIGTACIFCYRSFCRFICPLGAIYGLFNKFALTGVKVDENRCNGCGSCVRSCQMDVRHVGDHECIHCAKCMNVCNQNALSLKCGSCTILAPAAGCADDKADSAQNRDKYGKIAWGIALAVLCFALLWFNVLDPAVQAESPSPQAAIPAPSEAPIAAPRYESDAPEGNAVGQRLPDFTLSCYDGTVFRLAEQKGKITMINFWATYCTPCKQELPYFNDLYTAHRDDLAMIAVHPSLVLDSPEEYLADKGYALPFATDADDTVLRLVGSTGTYPQTVVLNRKGEVIYNKVGSVTPEVLEALFDEANQ